MLYTFHVTIHGRCGTAAAESLALTFDQAGEALQRLPRCYFEPDGSFVWAGNTDHGPWQVFGNLYDAGPRLSHVELNGACPATEFDQLLSCFGWPDDALMFQHVQRGVWVDESTFRGHAESSASEGNQPG